MKTTDPHPPGCECKRNECIVARYNAAYGVQPRPYSAPVPEDKHGKYSTYTNGCRCDRCKRAANNYQEHRKTELAGTLPYWSDKHGTMYGYQRYSCRCDKCKSAARDYREKRKEARRAG